MRLCRMFRHLLIFIGLTCIKAEYQNISVEIGLSVNISCQWPPNFEPTDMTWHGPPKKTRYCINENINPGLEKKDRLSAFIVKENRTFILQITQTEESDLGKYLCSVSFNNLSNQVFLLYFTDSKNDTGTTQLTDIPSKPLQCFVAGLKQTFYTVKIESNLKISVTTKSNDETEVRTECTFSSTTGSIEAQEHAMAVAFGFTSWLTKTHNNNVITCFLGKVEHNFIDHWSISNAVQATTIEDWIYRASFLDGKQMVCDRIDNELAENYENCFNIQGLVLLQMNQYVHCELNYKAGKSFNIRYSHTMISQSRNPGENASSGPYFAVYFVPGDNRIECLSKRNMSKDRDLVHSIVGSLAVLIPAGICIFICRRKVKNRQKCKEREVSTPLASDQVSSVVQNSLYSTVANEQAQRVQREPLNVIEENEFVHTDSSRDEDQRRLNYIEVHFDNSGEISQFSRTGHERTTEYMEIDFSRTIPNEERSRDGQ